MIKLFIWCAVHGDDLIEIGGVVSKAANIAIYPGTFDPITYGHLDMIDRGLKIIDEIIVAVGANPNKRPLFSIDERVDMVKKTAGKKRNVRVESFDGLLVDYAARKNVRAVIRGVRMFSDFEYEFQMALTNRKLNPKVETFFLMPNEVYSYLTSSHMKEIVSMGGDVSSYVPPYVYEKLRQKAGRV
ncbi:MAG: pantetheine-phosphate adenylyltransferase [Candidatus Omnitrophica bacterium]|nr:pantetheine-phosphate adenylyltransferase [Candidatus Omnitrophota bacterium]